MVDIYSAIVGEPPTEREKLDALAKKLRGRSMVGQLGMLTGDKVLAPMGQGIGAQAEAQAEKIGSFQARRRELEAQEAMRAASALERAKEAEINRQHDLSMLGQRQSFDASQSALSRALDKELAQIKAKDGGEDYTDLKFNDVRKLTADVAEADAISGVISNFKDEYAGTGLPGGRAISNWAASKGYGDKETKDAQKWWADWDRAYTLPVRNEMFGAALTATEQAAWEKANISPDMTPAQIREATATIEKIKRDVLARERETLKSAKFNPKQVDTAFGVAEAEAKKGPSTDPADYASYEEYVQAQGGG